MKLAGRKIEGANTETIVLPRGDGEPLVLVARAILDYKDFDAICPRPRPPVMLKPGGIREANPEDPGYKAATESHGKKRFAWIVITSLRLGTPDLEWDRVDYADSNTWAAYEDDFREAGLSEIETNRVVRGCMIANILDDDKLDEARKSFLAGRAAPTAPSSSPGDAPSDTPSGGPASA